MAESDVGPTTPVELVEALYARYPQAVETARRRLGRALTFCITSPTWTACATSMPSTT